MPSYFVFTVSHLDALVNLYSIDLSDLSPPKSVIDQPSYFCRLVALQNVLPLISRKWPNGGDVACVLQHASIYTFEMPLGQGNWHVKPSTICALDDDLKASQYDTRTQ
jgi:hypothetical protein